MNEIKQGFVFRFNTGAEFVILYTTDDGYYALCQTTNASGNVYMETQIYAVDSIVTWIEEGIAEKVGMKNIDVNISYTEN